VDLAVADAGAGLRHGRSSERGVALRAAITAAEARVQYDVRRVIESVYAHVLAMPETFLGRAPEKFDADGRLVDLATREALEKQLVAFRDWIVRVRRPVHA
jgi:hypothetical protein